MSFDLAMANLWSLWLQVTCVTAVAALASTIVRLRAPNALLRYWQLLLALCILLPSLQPWAPAPSATIAIESIHGAASTAGVRASAGLQLSTVLAIAILAGIAARGIWLALGWRRLRLYRRNARTRPAPECGIQELKSRIGAQANVYISSEIAVPIAFGFLHPVVLLPERWLSLDPERRTAIACHELIHVYRKDWLFHMAEELVRAAIWFHPAVWWIVDQIRLAREQVVDAEVVRLTGARRTYAQALLAFASPAAEFETGAAPAFFRKRHLRRRLSLIFEEVSMSRSRLFASLAVIALGVIGAGTFAVWSFPLQSPQPLPVRTAGEKQTGAQESFSPPRVISSVPPENGESARKPGSVVLDVQVAADGRVENAEVRDTLDPELDQNALAAVRQWKFEPARRDGEPVAATITVQITYPVESARKRMRRGIAGGVAGGVVDGIVGGVVEGIVRGVVDGVAGGIKDAVVTGVAGGVPQDDRVHDAHEEGVTMPTVLHKEDPKYTEAAKDEKVEGTVAVYLEVGPDGRAHNQHIERSLHPDLDKNTMDAISNWRFKPATKDGKAITVHATIEVNFQLK
jgi:TonB family protein